MPGSLELWAPRMVGMLLMFEVLEHVAVAEVVVVLVAVVAVVVLP